jgi:hypothetical protein
MTSAFAFPLVGAAFTLTLYSRSPVFSTPGSAARVWTFTVKYDFIPNRA